MRPESPGHKSAGYVTPENPTVRQVWQFLRPTLACVVCFLIAVTLLELVTLPAATDHHPRGTVRAQPDPRVMSLTMPSRRFRPIDVVQQQLLGLSDQDRARGTMQCWAFASPANRIATGPMDRFGRLVRKPPYDVLYQPEQVTLGAPILIESNARVLVSLIKDRRPHVFVWILSKQENEPFDGCWMTDAVFCIDEDPAPPSERPPPPAAPIL